MHTFAGGFRTDSDDYKNMEKKRHIKVAGVLFFVWTAVILYGSLSPGDDLPPMGWLARIPHFDKIVHFCFYLGQVLLLLLWLQPSRGNRIWVALCAIIFSGTIIVTFIFMGIFIIISDSVSVLLYHHSVFIT